MQPSTTAGTLSVEGAAQAGSVAATEGSTGGMAPDGGTGTAAAARGTDTGTAGGAAPPGMGAPGMEGLAGTGRSVAATITDDLTCQCCDWIMMQLGR